MKSSDHSLKRMAEQVLLPEWRPLCNSWQPRSKLQAGPRQQQRSVAKQHMNQQGSPLLSNWGFGDRLWPDAHTITKAKIFGVLGEVDLVHEVSYHQVVGKLIPCCFTTHSFGCTTIQYGPCRRGTISHEGIVHVTKIQGNIDIGRPMSSIIVTSPCRDFFDATRRPAISFETRTMLLGASTGCGLWQRSWKN